MKKLFTLIAASIFAASASAQTVLESNSFENVYKGIKPLTGTDIADVAYYAASAPEHVQIAEVLVLATHQANGTVVCRGCDD